MKLIIGSRKSDLARIQAHTVGEALLAKFPIEIEYLFKESLGDKNLTDPLWQAPEKGLFTEDFYMDLVNQKVDLVVHSWKDLPVVEKEKTFVCATLKREDSRDLLLFKKESHKTLNSVAKTGAIRIMTSSPRRSHNLRNFAQNYLPMQVNSTNFVSVRGNISTRIQKFLADETCHGLILAKAAIDRLLKADLEEFANTKKFIRESLEILNWVILPSSLNPTAAAQGALAIEICRDRKDLLSMLSSINDIESWSNVLTEREILKSHGGGCHQAIGVNCMTSPFGVITRVLGMNEKGLELSSHELQNTAYHIPKKHFRSIQVSSSSLLAARRQALVQNKIQSLTEGHQDKYILLVTKDDAWPNDLTFNGEIWTSGLSTWRKLVQKGIWVNGTLDNLGEDHFFNSNHYSHPLGPSIAKKWLKLTHSQSHLYGQRNQIIPLQPIHSQLIEPVETYEIQWSFKNQEDKMKLMDYDCYYWSSASLFAFAIKELPELKYKLHACGIGNTAHYISTYLMDENLSPEKHLSVYLSQEHWQKEFT